MPKILVIDDRRDNLLAIEALLEHLIPECQVFTAQSGMEGLEKAYEIQPDTILLDIQMPVMNGYEVCKRLKADERTSHIPVIMVTAIETDTQSRIKGLEIGGDAFIAKPIDEEELAAQVNVMLRIKQSQGKLQREKETLEVREKQHSQALRESEEKFRLLVEGTHDLITLINAEGIIRWANPEWEKVFGAVPDKGTSLFELITPETRPTVENTWIKMINEQIEIRNLEYCIIPPGLASKVIEVEATIHNAELDGEHLYYVIAHDITERKGAEKALLESEERYRTITENSPDIIMRYDRQLRHLYVSPNVTSIFGKKAEEFPGKRYREMDFPEDMQITWEKAIIKTFKTGEQQELEYEYHSPMGPMVISLRLKPEYATDNEVESVIGVFRDITERRRLEDQLRQAQKMEAIGTLAGGIAHDFNNILGIIIGYTELTLDDITEDSPPFQNLKQVLSAANRAGEMVKQILAFSRKSEKEKRPLYLNHVLKEALSMLRSTLPATIQIQAHIDQESEPVLANPTQIHQVIMNLSTNASHAMRENGGVLEFTLKEIDFDPAVINRQDMEPGRYQQLTVRDTGHGMQRSIMERIFEPYFTTKEPGEGTGMGLSVVHGIVKSHGGEITVDSEPGRGTTFDIFLPVTKEIQVVRAEKMSPIAGGSEHILFVDDEKSLAEMGKLMLEKMGYQVSIRTSSVEVLEAFRKAPHKYDLVITDQTMPNMTGTQLTRELMRIRPDIPVILCTGFSETINNENFKALGIRAFVMKPIIKNEISRVIREVLDAK